MQPSTREELTRLIDEAEAVIDALQDDLLGFAEALLGPDGALVLCASIAREEERARHTMHLADSPTQEAR